MNYFKNKIRLFLSKLGQGIILWVGFFAVAGVAFATITWPSTLPDGESDGWSFATILKQMLENTNLADTTNTGTVKYARDSDKVDGLHASDLLASGGGGVSSTSSAVVVLAWHQTCPIWYATFQISSWGKCMIPTGVAASVWSSYNATNASNAASTASANGEVICGLNGSDTPSGDYYYNWNSFFVMRNEVLAESITISSGDQTVCIKD